MSTEPTCSEGTARQSDVVTVSKQALIDAVLDWERRLAVQHLLLERSLEQAEVSLRQCRSLLSGCGVVQAKGALLGLFCSDMEWDGYLRQGLMDEENAGA